MRENRLLRTLRAGKVATGLVIPILSPDVVEICGHAGFDFAFIDCEHGPIGIEGCQEMVRAADTVGITPIVRIPKHTVHEINRYLDLGAQGVIVPHVNTAEDARRAVAEAQFSPRGHRGAASSSRASGFGLPQDADTYFREVNKEILVLPLIEEPQAVDDLDGILTTEGIEAIVIGPGDMALAMGLGGARNHPEVEARLDRAVAAARRHGKVAGTVTGTPDGARDLVRRGFRIVIFGVTGLFIRSANEMLKAVREASPA